MRRKYTLPDFICPTIHNQSDRHFNVLVQAVRLFVFFITSQLNRQRAVCFR